MSRIRKTIVTLKDRVGERSPFYVSLIFIDYVFTRIFLKFNLEEYLQYKMYRLRNHAKKEYVSEYDVLHRIPERINHDKKTNELFNNKEQFNRVYHAFIGRCTIDGQNLQEFQQFAKDLDEMIVKPLDSMCGHGVEKIDLRGKNTQEVYDRIYSTRGKSLAEKIIQQHEAIAAFNPDSVNTLRVITLNDGKGGISVPAAAIRIGRSGASIDNFCAGGMAAVIDPEEGIVITGAYDKDNVRYIRHPDTGLVIVGFQIPYWERVLETVRQTAAMTPEVRLIGWDVVVKQNGEINLIEGNISPGARTIQMPIKEGLRKEYRSILGRF